MRTLIYRRWYETHEYVFEGHITKAVEGVDGVESFYVHVSGSVEIRMSDPDAPEYWVPAAQVLALMRKD